MHIIARKPKKAQLKGVWIDLNASIGLGQEEGIMGFFSDWAQARKAKAETERLMAKAQLQKHKAEIQKAKAQIKETKAKQQSKQLKEFSKMYDDIEKLKDKVLDDYEPESDEKNELEQMFMKILTNNFSQNPQQSEGIQISDREKLFAKVYDSLNPVEKGLVDKKIQEVLNNG